MSQWNALNVNVIKTRKIECAKLNLPPVFAKSPRRKSTPSPIRASTQTESADNKDCKEQLNQSNTDGSISLLSTEDSFSSSTYTGDEVFQDSFETPPEKDGCFSRSSTKRCLSLPAYLGYEEEHDNRVHSQVCFRPRRLFEEALNLESCSGSSQSNKGDLGAPNQDLSGSNFPRFLDQIHKRHASRTPHAERMKSTESSSLITCDNNNNSQSDQNNLESTTSKSKFEQATQSKGSFDVRAWEQKVLVLTSDYEFGTEFSRKLRDESEPRSKSVALTENISTIADDKIAKGHNPERQVKSDTNSEMPKLQTVVWDYIKRKSTKRKRKNETSNLQKDENLKEESLKTTNQECSSKSVDESGKDGLPKNEKNYEADSPGKPGKHVLKKVPDVSKKSRLTKSWKSSPNLKPNCDAQITANIPLRRYHSHTHLYPSPNKKPSPKLLAKEPKMNSETLTFQLTTATEEKSMHERMMTLKLSREWLVRELKSMREEDRKLARQFIHLRSAIVELREYCEKDDSEYESECEGTPKMIETKSLHKDNKRNALSKEHKIHIRETPTRNILSYC